MIPAPLPSDEERRLARLHALAVLDTAREPLFDGLANLASELSGMPIALVSLVDADRQWFKAGVGLPGVSQTPRDVAFCGHAILGSGILEVSDALADTRFLDNPLVTGDPHIRSYVGAPLTMPGGERVGTLCVIGREPRQLSAQQKRQLAALAESCVQALLLRERIVQHEETGRRAAEAVVDRLRESQAFLDRSGRMAGVGAWQIDLPTGRITWSDQTCRIHDMPEGHEPTLDEGLAYYAPEARPVIEAAVQRSLADGLPWDLELPLVTAKGRRIWIRTQAEVEFEGGKAVRLMGAFQDVTRRRETDAALAASSEQLRRFYETTPAMLHCVDMQARLVSVSNRWLETLGWQRSEVIGRDIASFLAPASREHVLGNVRPRMLIEGQVEDVALEMLRRDGSALSVRLSAIVEHDAQGRPQFALAILEDVTEKLERTAELRRERDLRQRLERQARELNVLLAERSEMLDVLAHEVRQPLHNAQAALQSAASALAQRGEATGADPLARARRTLGVVLAGIDNTLAAASLLAGARALAQVDGDIAALIAVVVADMPATDRDRILIEHDRDLRTAAMDSGLMRLALRNLLANALRAAPSGTPVVLRVRDREEPPELVFSVSDLGPGIPGDLLPQLFERGVRGPAAPGRVSHGLGLYIVRRVMELHGGRAEVESTSESGTTMRLVLPQGPVDG